MAGYDIPTPNFATAALGGYQAGQAIGQQRRKQAALELYRTDPDHGLDALDTVDPQLAEQLRANKERREKRAALASVFGQPPAAPAPQALGTPPAAPTAMPAAPMDAAPQGAAPPPAEAVTLQSHGPQINQAAMAHLFQVDPDTAFALQKHITELDKTQREQLKEAEGALSSVGIYLRRLPYAQRRQELARLAPDLQQHGVTPEQLQGFDPTDANIDSRVALALGAQGMLAQQDKDRTFAATQADKASDNARADRGLAVREGALGLARQREGRVGKGGSGSSDNSDLNYLLGGN